MTGQGSGSVHTDFWLRLHHLFRILQVSENNKTKISYINKQLDQIIQNIQTSKSGVVHKLLWVWGLPNMQANIYNLIYSMDRRWILSGLGKYLS